MTPAEALEALLLEAIPIRPTRPKGCHLGPTAQWAAVEAQRELWALAAEDEREERAS